MTAAGSRVKRSVRPLAELVSALLLLLLLLVAPGSAAPVQAAEVLQVRGPTLLQLGDRNRSYSVELVCLEVPTNHRDEAIGWLRERLPRRTRVNLKPMGEHDGLLMARVQRLNDDLDLSSGLIAAGLAAPSPCPWA